MNDDMKPRFGPSPSAPASLEYVESCCYPVFVQPILCPDNPRHVCGLDGWHVKPTGNWADDYQTGGWFAEDAVFWSRIMGVGFLNFVLASLVAKGPASYTAVEYGFLSKICSYAHAGSLN
jgi:hypothetical protein